MAIARALTLLILAVAALAGGVGGALGQQPGDGPVRVLELTGSIDPVAADWVGARIGVAEREGASVVVIRIDTPGGLATSMEDIVGRMRGSGVPVAVWVGPSGARATSAGAFVAAASPHVLMAPGTTIGSATPVSGGGEDLDRKVVNDAAASITALAEENGRDPRPWRAMVVDAENLTVSQARAAGVADAIAPDLDAVLAWLDGRPDGAGGEIATAGAPVAVDAIPWYLRALQAIIDPNLVFALLLLGLFGIASEVLNPGGIIPGAAGLIALLVGLAGLSALPFNWVGLALLLVGVGLLFAETQVPGFGALAAGGVVAVCLGGVFLFGSGDDGIATSPWVVVPLGALVGGGAAWAGRRVVAAHRNRPQTGADTMVGVDAVARTPVDAASGRVLLNGELWSARAAGEDVYPPGTPLRVVRVDAEKLVVTVEPRVPTEE